MAANIVGLLIAVAAAAWVYTDSKKHGVPNGVLWAVVSFFFSIIGVAIYYFAIRGPHLKKLAAGGQGQLPPQ